MPRKPGIVDRIEYALFQALTTGMGSVSHARAERWGETLGRFAYRRVGVRREVVLDQLRHAFPEQDEAWIERTAVAAYEHVGREAITILRMSRMSRNEVIERVNHSTGQQRFADAIAEGKGVVLVAGHIGNWELGASLLAAQGHAIDVLYQPARNPLWNAEVVSARERLGLNLIPRSGASKAALRKLREGHIVAIVADQNAGRTGIFVPFLGRLASTHRGPALLAIRSGAPLFLGASIRQGDGYYGISEEITASREGEVDKVVERLTRAWSASLEKLVRQWPEQYFWHHRRWKTRPPAEGKDHQEEEPEGRRSGIEG